MQKNKEIFYSVDIESDGKIPIRNSMLSLGCAAFSDEGVLLDIFEINLKELEGAVGDRDTLAWWKTQPAAWEHCRQNTVDPKQAMEEFDKWVRDLCAEHKASPVFLAYPAGYDFTWVYFYLIYFLGESPFSFSALDIKSFAMAVLKTPFRQTTKRNFPKSWKKTSFKHSHKSLEDAIGQGEMFFNILKEIK